MQIVKNTTILYEPKKCRLLKTQQYYMSPFNCKLKTFRAEFRGVNDLKFYLYRVKQLFA